MGKACPLVAYSEQRFLRIPWSALSDETAAGARRILYKERAGRDRFRLWETIAGPAGMPGPFDRAVFRACEWMAHEQSLRSGGTLEQPFSFRAREICERLCLREHPSVAAAIRRSLQRLSGLRIRRPQEEAHPGQRDVRLLSADGCLDSAWTEVRALDVERQIRFLPPLTEAANAGTLVPLNWELWVSLSPIARRLLEVISLGFASQDNGGPLALGCMELAAQLPLRHVGTSAAARKALAPAHDELRARNYIQEPRWEGNDPFCRILYVPDEACLALKSRLAPLRTPSFLAREIAAALHVPERAGEYQELVNVNDPERIQAALEEIRLLRKCGLSKQQSPRQVFDEILRRDSRAARRA